MTVRLRDERSSGIGDETAFPLPLSAQGGAFALPPRSGLTIERASAVAVLVGGGLLVRWSLLPLLGQHAVYLTVYPVIAFAAIFWGKAPGLLASGVGLLTADYFFVEPFLEVHLTSASFISFLVVGGSTLFLGHVGDRWRTSEAALRASAEAARLAEVALRESERRYRGLFTAMDEGFQLCELVHDERGRPNDYRFLDVNPAFERHSGLTRDQVVGKTVRQVVPDIEQHWIDVYARVATTGEPARYENFARGLGRWYAVVAFCPAPGRFASISFDVTERRRTEESLRRREAELEELAASLQRSNVQLSASQERYRLLNQTTHDVIWDWDLARDVLSWNEALESAFGYRLSRVPPDIAWWGEHVHPDDRARVVRALDEAIDDPDEHAWNSEYRFRHRDGHWLNVLDRGFIARDEHGRAVRMIGSMLDVTEHKRAEEALRSSEATLHAVLDALPIAVVVADAQGRVVRDNAATRELWGVPPETTSWEEYSDWVAWWPDTGERIKAEEWAMTRAIHFGEVTRNQLVQNQRFGSHERRFFLHNVVPLRDAEGRITGGVAAMLDTTDRLLAEEKLRASERKFRSVFEQAAIGMGRVNFADARWTDVNDAFTRMLGYGRDEMLRMPWPDMTHPDDVELDRVPFLRMAKGELDSYTVEKRFVHREGHHVWTRLTLSLVRDAQGRPDYEIAIIEDIADRKRTEEALRASEAKLRAMFRALTEGVAFVNLRGEVEEANDAVREHGHTLEELTEPGHGLRSRVIRPDGSPLPADEQPTLVALRTGQAVRNVEVGVRLPDGTIGWRLVNAQPVRDDRGNLLGSVGSFFDITDRKRAEEDLKRANLRLEEADRHKNEFLAMLSHELRNPLAPIRNSLYILERAEPGGPQAKRAHDVIGRQVTHMTRLIDDLLDVTRISRGKIRLQLEPVELCDLVHRTTEDHRSVFINAGVQLEVFACSAPLPVEADPTRLSQVIGNLLSNAVKFTPRGGRVELSLTSNGTAASILVHDEGAGIPSAILETLFQPFVQADATLDRSRGGLGLGLALVKSLVELHGGSVAARSDGPGRGSEFVVTLPLRTTKQPDGPTEGARVPGEGLRGRRILVVEDNVDAALSLKEVLELGGHEVDVAYSGTDGIERALAWRPDLVLCDLGLPGTDGFGVARTLRADPSTTGLFLVALSGYASQEDVAKSIDAGFDRHLAKPPSIDALERLVVEGTRAQRASP